MPSLEIRQMALDGFLNRFWGRLFTVASLPRAKPVFCMAGDGLARLTLQLPTASMPARRLFKPRGDVVDGRKRDFAIANQASSKLDYKSVNSETKTKGVERRTIRRLKILKSKDWYEKAALSVQISGRIVTKNIQAYANIEKY
jgi:hypothetical protein